MPSSDYTSAIRGGLKLKGSATGAGIDKKKKKSKKKHPKPTDPADEDDDDKQLGKAPTTEEPDPDLQAESNEISTNPLEKDELESLARAKARDEGKTEAERRYEERRRKRLDERLRREGVQTHKERVEKLNKYLSGLSEHHDMPRIGPG